MIASRIGDLSCGTFICHSELSLGRREESAKRSEAQPKNLIENEFLHYVQDKPSRGSGRQMLRVALDLNSFRRT